MKARKVRSALVLVLSAAAGCGQADGGGGGSLSGIDESFLDRSTDACSDFYQFACGTWIKEHPTDKTSSVERWFEGDARNAYLLRKILESDQMGTPYVPHADSAALGNYYGACMVSRSSDFVEGAKVNDRLRQVGSIASMTDLARVLGQLHVDGVSAFFSMYPAIDPGNPLRRIATFGPGGLGFDESYYLDATMSILPQYEEHMRALVALHVSLVPGEAPSTVAFETALARATLADAAARDPVATYNLLALDAFAATASHFPWSDYFSALGYSSVAEVNVTQPGYLMGLDALFAATPLETLKGYLAWRTLEAYAHTLGKRLVAEEAKFHYGVFTGDPSVPPDWWACLNSTRWARGFEMSRPFVAVRFDQAERDGASAMIASIKQAFRTELTTRDWLDPSTRASAESKLDKIAEKVGFPDLWPAAAPFFFNEDYQTQVFGISNWFASRRAALLNEPTDRSAWSTPPCVTNAFYSPVFNEIVFPAAVLQTPQYAVGRARAINYGAIGAVMGHELTHGFDDRGRHFDGDGKLTDWWGPGVDGEFLRRTSCLVDQYAGYEPLPGVKLDGAATLGENIADLGGLRLAYAAYQASGAGESFVGSFTADQQFFLAYAQLWCANFNDEVLANSVRADVHAPPKFRVNGVVSNLPEFAAAFQCASGTPMAPASRCDVW